MSSTRIVELANAIQSATVNFDGLLRSQNLPTPSFDPGMPLDYPLDPQGAASRLAILDAIEELRQLLICPLGIITNIVGHNYWISLQAITQFNIASSVPAEGDGATYEEIAQKCGLSEQMTRRLIRHAMTARVFREKKRGVVSHTAASKVLADNKLMRDWLLFSTAEMWPAATRTVDAMIKWPESPEPNQTGWNLHSGIDKPMWDAWSDQPEKAERFASAMSLFQQDPGLDPRHVVDNYPWGELGSATVVDIGGSHGGIMVAVAKKFPDIKFIVQDLPEVIREGPEQIPAQVAERIEFMAHDFFTEQPVKGADVYQIRWCLHDWSDKYCIKILKALALGMRPGSRLVIWDMLLPEPGTIPNYAEQMARTMDLAMLEAFNGKEREAGEWEQLLQAADPRFKLKRTMQPPGSNLGLIEAVWEL